MGTLTINTTAEQDARILSAFGKQLATVDVDGNPRDATAAEVKAEVIGFIKTIVVKQEEDEAIQAAIVTVPDVGDIT